MLTARELSVRYDNVAAVDEVSFEVADGRVLALLGPSGCGKSSLLRAIAGIEPVAGGTVAWDGVDLARIPVHRRGFGLLFQEGVLFPHRTVAGNIAYGLSRGRDARDRVTELLDLVGLPGYENRRVDTLSGGEAQRVALARALAPRPRLLLLDEPLAALDRALHDQLLRDLRAVLAETGTTAIFVTHDQSEAFAVADDLAVMREGRIIHTGLPHQVWARPVDRDEAEFLGCTSIIGGELVRGGDGRWHVRTAVGNIPAGDSFAGDVPGVGAAGDSPGGDVPGGGVLGDKVPAGDVSGGGVLGGGVLGGKVPVGDSPDNAVQVGLRPAALVCDPAGGLVGEIMSVTLAPERQLLTVRLRPGAASYPARAVVGGRDHPVPGAASYQVQAVTSVGNAVTPGATIRLRFDPAHTALIGNPVSRT